MLFYSYATTANTRWSNMHLIYNHNLKCLYYKILVKPNCFQLHLNWIAFYAKYHNRKNSDLNDVMCWMYFKEFKNVILQVLPLTKFCLYLCPVIYGNIFLKFCHIWLTINLLYSLAVAVEFLGLTNILKEIERQWRRFKTVHYNQVNLVDYWSWWCCTKLSFIWTYKNT